MIQRSEAGKTKESMIFTTGWETARKKSRHNMKDGKASAIYHEKKSKNEKSYLSFSPMRMNRFVLVTGYLSMGRLLIFTTWNFKLELLIILSCRDFTL